MGTVEDAELDLTTTMIEPVDEKEARSDHHARQGLRKPGDRAKKFSNKNAPRGSSPTRAHQRKARQGHFVKPVEGDRPANPKNGRVSLKEGAILLGSRDEQEIDSDREEVVLNPPAENIQREVPMETLLAGAYKKPRKPKGIYIYSIYQRGFLFT